MSFIERLRGDNSVDQDVADELVELLSSREETLAVIDPVTSGLISYRLSSEEFATKVLAGSYVPSSRKSYQQFIELDEVERFPNKQVANEHDAQLLANRVAEIAGADHGVSVVAPLDGTKRETFFVGVNISGRQVGVFQEEFNLDEGYRKKISKYVLRKLLHELES